MIGVYFNDEELDLLIPLLVSQIHSLFTYPGFREQDKEVYLVRRRKYEEMLGRIYASKNIGL